MEISTGAARKKDKSQVVEQPQPVTAPPIPSPPTSPPEKMDITPPIQSPAQEPSQLPLPPTPPAAPATPPTVVPAVDLSKDLAKINSMCDELLNKPLPELPVRANTEENSKKIEQSVEQVPTPKEPTKPVVKKTFNKGKTSDLSGAIKKVSPGSAAAAAEPKTTSTESNTKKVERKNSLPEETLKPERRKSRILETAEKFQSMNNQNNEKYKKFVIPGVSVGSFKKEFERKTSLTPTSSVIGPMERKQRNSESSAASRQNSQEDEGKNKAEIEQTEKGEPSKVLKESDSKSSVGSFSLEEARRSMENSIALLNQAKSETSVKDLEQLCAKTEGVALSEGNQTTMTSTSTNNNNLNINERENKLKNAREIISNAIPRLGGGRKPPMPFGANGRTASGNLATGYSRPVKLGDASPPMNTPTSAHAEPPVFPPVKGIVKFDFSFFIL